MSQRNFLPRLHNAKVADAPVSEWTPITNAAELSRLHHGDGDDTVLRTRVRSIPNPWARMLLFRAAIQQDDHYWMRCSFSSRFRIVRVSHSGPSE
jgi:hypothetical protein